MKPCLDQIEKSAQVVTTEVVEVARERLIIGWA